MTKRFFAVALLCALLCSATALAEPPATPEGPWTAHKDTPVTIEWFFAMEDFGTRFDPENNLAHAQILADTGVSLSISSGNEEKLNMLIATDTLPDLVSMGSNASQRVMLENAGMLAPLEPLIEEYVPDINIPHSMFDWYRNENTGECYAIAGAFYSDERCNPEFGGMFVTHNKNIVRADILSQIGMTVEDLQTKEGFLAALRAVKENDITYNGQSVMPLGAYDLEMIATQFGWKPEAEDGSLVSLWRDEKYLEALLFLNTIYSEGLMGDEVFTWNATQRNEAVANGSVFAGIGWTGIHTSSRRALYANDNNAMFQFAGRMDGGEAVWYPGVSCQGWILTMISANSEIQDRIIEFIAYMATDIVTLNSEHGIGCYEIVDGKVVKLPDKQAEFDANPTLAGNKYKDNLNGFTTDWTIIQKYWPDNYSNPLEEDIAKAEMEHDALLYDSKCFSGLDPEAGTDLAAINTMINDYWNQQVPLIIMADSAQACEAAWRDALAEIDGMGFAQIEAYRAERFANNKARMGLEFAYPGNR